MRTLLAATAAVLVVTIAAGCGSDPDPATSTVSTDALRAAAADVDVDLTVTDGITPDDLVGCLTSAGLDAELTDSVPFGVDVPVAEIDVTGLADYSGEPDQTAYLFVFSDPADAAANAGTLTLGGSDDPSDSRFGLHRNVVRSMGIVVADPPSSDEAALLACLPGSATPPPTPTTPTSPPATTPDPPAASVDSLLACLDAAGLNADGGPDEGLDWAGSISVYGMDFYKQAATVYVFADAASAAAEPELTTDGSDPRTQLAGNTVTVWNRKPRTDQPDTAALIGCLPAA